MGRAGLAAAAVVLGHPLSPPLPLAPSIYPPTHRTYPSIQGEEEEEEEDFEAIEEEDYSDDTLDLDA